MLNKLALWIKQKKNDEIFKETRKTCPGPEKNCYKLLEDFSKNLKPLPVYSYLAQ